MIGIICGLKTEAKIADKIPNVLVGCSAARPARARALVQEMISQGVTRLISFGLAGGIASDLVPGDLFLGATVMTAHDAWETDVPWNEKFFDKLPTVLSLPVWGSDYMASKVEDKALIFRRTGCSVVDMESHIVAVAADANRIPFNVVRAVCDPYDMALPSVAKLTLKEDGSVDMRAVFKAIKKEPLQIPSLMRLGMATSRALSSLKLAVEVMCEMGEG